MKHIKPFLLLSTLLITLLCAATQSMANQPWTFKMTSMKLNEETKDWDSLDVTYVWMNQQGTPDSIIVRSARAIDPWYRVFSSWQKVSYSIADGPLQPWNFRFAQFKTAGLFPGAVKHYGITDKGSYSLSMSWTSTFQDSLLTEYRKDWVRSNGTIETLEKREFEYNGLGEPTGYRWIQGADTLHEDYITRFYGNEGRIQSARVLAKNNSQVYTLDSLTFEYEQDNTLHKLKGWLISPIDGKRITEGSTDVYEGWHTFIASYYVFASGSGIVGGPKFLKRTSIPDTSYHIDASFYSNQFDVEGRLAVTTDMASTRSWTYYANGDSHEEYYKGSNSPLILAENWNNSYDQNGRLLHAMNEGQGHVPYRYIFEYQTTADVAIEPTPIEYHNSLGSTLLLNMQTRPQHVVLRNTAGAAVQDVYCSNGTVDLHGLAAGLYLVFVDDQPYGKHLIP